MFAGAGMSIIMAAAPSWVEALPGLAPLAMAPIVALGFAWLKAPTREGRAVIDQIEGLKLYLGTAEEERLDYLTPPEKTPRTVRALPPLCRRPRRRKPVGRALRRDPRRLGGRRRGHVLVFGPARLDQRSRRLRRPARQPVVGDDRRGVDRAGIERRIGWIEQLERQQRRRIVRRRRWRRRRLRLVEAGSYLSLFAHENSMQLRHQFNSLIWLAIFCEYGGGLYKNLVLRAVRTSVTTSGSIPLIH